MSRRTLTATLLGLAALAGPAPGEDVALRGGRVIPVEGPEFEAGTVLVRDGRIVEVGPVDAVEVPYDARVIDTTDRVVFPGMVLAHTSDGLDRANESLPVTPYLDVRDAINPAYYVFEDFLRDGVTAVHVIQGQGTVIGGVGRVVRPMGLTVDEMTLKAPSGLKVAVNDRRGWDRVRQRAALREAFAELADHLDGLAEARYAAEQEEAGEEVTVGPERAREIGRELIRAADVDEQHRNLWLLVEGRLDAYVYCERAQDVPFAVDLAREHGFLARTTFVLGGECYKAADLLKETGRPVVLPLSLTWREEDPATGRHDEVGVAGVFAAAGVPFALRNNPDASFAERFLWYQAALCVRQGVDRATALRAITLEAARALGLEGEVGSIAPGKAADLLVLSGDPLSATTHVERVLLEGEVVYEREKDFRLRRLLEGDAEHEALPLETPPHGDEREDTEGRRPDPEEGR